MLRWIIVKSSHTDLIETIIGVWIWFFCIFFAIPAHTIIELSLASIQFFATNFAYHLIALAYNTNILYHNRFCISSHRPRFQDKKKHQHLSRSVAGRPVLEMLVLITVATYCYKCRAFATRYSLCSFGIYLTVA